MDTPSWALDLLMDILDYEDVHENVGNAKQDGQKVVCFSKTLQKVPSEMLTAARVTRDFLVTKNLRESK